MNENEIWREYRRTRWRFGIIVYAAAFAIYAMYVAPLYGLWAFGYSVFVVFAEWWLWVNIGLPRAARRGSEPFQRMYFGEDGTVANGQDLDSDPQDIPEDALRRGWRLVLLKPRRLLYLFTRKIWYTSRKQKNQ